MTAGHLAGQAAGQRGLLRRRCGGGHPYIYKGCPARPHAHPHRKRPFPEIPFLPILGKVGTAHLIEVRDVH
jgi:hypothetical protein